MSRVFEMPAGFARTLGVVVAVCLAIGGVGAARAQDTPAGEAAPDASPGDAPEVVRQGEARLDMLRAQLLLATGRFGEARQLYERLRVEMPQSADPLIGLAAVARETGRQRLSGSLLAQALLLDPGNPSVANALGTYERERGPRLRLDVEQRFQRGGLGLSRADITVSEAGGYVTVGEAWRIGVTQGVAYVDAKQVQRADGGIDNFSGIRARSEIFVQHEWIEGQVLTASLFGTEWAAGFGLVARLPDDYGYTALRAEYQRPIWDFVEAIIEGATRDRVAVERSQRFSGNLTGRLDVGLNRYGIPRDDDDLLRSATVRGDLRLGGIGGVPGLSLGYALDAEYVLSQDEKVNATGSAFQPLPVLDREVHAGLLGYGGSYGSGPGEGQLTYQASVGYGMDRYGRSGPLAFGSIGYALGAFEFVLRAGHVRNIGRSQGNTTTVGGALVWVF